MTDFFKRKAIAARRYVRRHKQPPKFWNPITKTWGRFVPQVSTHVVYGGNPYASR